MELALRDSVQDVLERMFFIDVAADPADFADDVSPCSHDLAARVSFEGDPSGALTLRISCAAARQIAADFLGAEIEEVSERQVVEVICELSNMICGSLLSRVEDAATFKLSAPSLLPSDEAGVDSDTNQYTVTLPNGTLNVHVSIGVPPCLHAAPSGC